MEEARNAGTGDSGDEDRNNPGTGDSERVLSVVVSSSSVVVEVFSFLTKVGDVSLFRWLLVLITIVSASVFIYDDVDVKQFNGIGLLPQLFSNVDRCVVV